MSNCLIRMVSRIDKVCTILSSARIDVTLDQTGTHSILVTEYGNDATMDYALALERIMPPSASATPINPGQMLPDAIDPVGDMDLFFFQGSNGDTVAVQATRQGGGTPCVELFDPDGVQIDKVCTMLVPPESMSLWIRQGLTPSLSLSMEMTQRWTMCLPSKR